MPKFTATDPVSGKSVTLTGDSPPTEQELTSIFNSAPSEAPLAEQAAPSIFKGLKQGLSGAWKSDVGALNELGRGVALLPPNPNAGIYERAANWVGQNVPAGIGASLGVPLGAAIGAGGGPAGIIAGGAAGASFGSSLIRGEQQAINALSAPDQMETSERLQDVAKTGAIQGLTEGAGQLGVKAVTKLGPKVLDYLATSKTGGAIAPAAWDYFKNNVERTAKFIGSGPERANEVASSIRSSIGDLVETLEQNYRNIAGKIRDGAGGELNLNLKGAIKDTIDSVREDFGYNKPITASEPTPTGLLDASGKPILRAQEQASNGIERVAQSRDIALFDDFARVANKLDKATPQQIYFFQRDLNNAIGNNEGKPIAAALGEIKSRVNQFINNNSDKLPDLVEANKNWASAKELEQETKRLVNADDIIGYINQKFRNPLNTLSQQAMEGISSFVPKVPDGAEEVPFSTHLAQESAYKASESIKNARAIEAAKSLNPLVRSMTGTGFETGLGVMGAATYAAAHPAALLATPILPIFSPRAYAAAYRYAPQAAETLGKNAPALATAGRAAVQGLFGQATQAMSPESIAAFYRSPGAP